MPYEYKLIREWIVFYENGTKDIELLDDAFADHTSINRERDRYCDIVECDIDGHRRPLHLLDRSAGGINWHVSKYLRTSSARRVKGRRRRTAYGPAFLDCGLKKVTAFEGLNDRLDGSAEEIADLNRLFGACWVVTPGVTGMELWVLGNQIPFEAVMRFG
jgi:hypothetical protein